MAAGGDPDRVPGLDPDSDDAPPATAGMAAAALSLAALVLLLLAPVATRRAPMERGWFLEPIVWPLVALGMALLAGTVLLGRFALAWHRSPYRPAFWRQAWAAFDGMGRALEYTVYFCLFLWAVGYLGFALGSLIFLQVMFWRAGLRGWKWIGIATLITVALVAIFRVGIGIWFPLAPIFRLLPDWVGNSVGSVL